MADLIKSTRGLSYMSDYYARAKTMAILVHRSVLPAEVAAKLCHGQADRVAGN